MNKMYYNRKNMSIS